MIDLFVLIATAKDGVRSEEGEVSWKAEAMSRSQGRFLGLMELAGAAGDHVNGPPMICDGDEDFVVSRVSHCEVES